jgi:3-oxoacyl-(acyl-carrier-protein) synthase
MTKRRRVAITGIGLVTPVGNDVATTWAALDGVKSGAAPITLFDASGFPTRFAAEVKGFDDGAITAPRKFLNQANRSQRFALAAAEQAMRDSGIEPQDADRDRWGCAVGTGMMGVSFDELAATQRHSAPDGALDPHRLLTDAEAADPLAFCRSQTRRASLLTRRSAFAAIRHPCIRHARPAARRSARRWLIRRGAVDRALAGGFDSMISPVGLAGFCLLSAVSTDNERRSARVVRSMRRATASCSAKARASSCSRNGKRRGRRAIYAELAGDGNSLSSYRITDSPPDGDGPIQSMQAALADARAMPADIDYINAHGTSTGMNDRSESAAIHAVFGADAKRVWVSSTKSSMGHLIAAAGAVEVALCALVIDRAEMPVNANYRESDLEGPQSVLQRRDGRRCADASNLLAGGSNSCIVLRSPELVETSP